MLLEDDGPPKEGGASPLALKELEGVREVEGVADAAAATPTVWVEVLLGDAAATTPPPPPPSTLPVVGVEVLPLTKVTAGELVMLVRKVGVGRLVKLKMLMHWDWPTVVVFKPRGQGVQSDANELPEEGL